MQVYITGIPSSKEAFCFDESSSEAPLLQLTLNTSIRLTAHAVSTHSHTSAWVLHFQMLFIPRHSFSRQYFSSIVAISFILVPTLSIGRSFLSNTCIQCAHRRMWREREREERFGRISLTSSQLVLSLLEK